MTNTNEYMREYMARRRANRRTELVQMLGGKCVACAATTNLDFDHVVPGSKKFQLSGRSLDMAWPKILAEASKCQLLCAPCHRDKSVQMHETVGGWNRGIAGSNQVHGTAACYSELGCRCKACVQAKKLYRAKAVTYHGDTEYKNIGSHIKVDFMRLKLEDNRRKQDHVIGGAPAYQAFDASLVEVQKKVRKTKYCQCGGYLEHNLTYCSEECRSRYKPVITRSKRPPLSELMLVVEAHSLVSAGKIFGVSDNAVRKWLKFYGKDPLTLCAYRKGRHP